MPRGIRLIRLINAAMASVFALSVATPNTAQAQTRAAEAYRLAQQIGTIQAYEDFIARFPLSDEASDAFVQIVTLTRGSVLEDNQISRGFVFPDSDNDESRSGSARSSSTSSERSGTDPY